MQCIPANPIYRYYGARLYFNVISFTIQIVLMCKMTIHIPAYMQSLLLNTGS